MMLGIMRQARCGSAVSVMTRLAQSLIAADPPASSLHSATAAVAAQPLTNLRQFSPTQSFTGAWCSEVPSSGQHSMPHVHSAAFTTSSARRQDSQPSSALPAGLNPLQAIPGAEAGGNPLSVVPQPTEPPREPIAQAVLRSIKISPHKLADFARVVRRLHVEDAMVQCKASVKKPAKLVYKVGRSACLEVMTVISTSCTLGLVFAGLECARPQCPASDHNANVRAGSQKE